MKTYDGPLFLTGVYRSGTTLIAQVLNNHPQLRVTYETLHFFRFYLGKYVSPEEHYRDIIEQAGQRLDQRFGIKVPTDRISDRLQSSPRLDFKHIYQAIMVETFCDGNEDLRWGEKSLMQWTNIPLFLQMFPAGQAIHIIRDPRDVLASYREMTNEAPHRYLDAVFACLHSLNWAATVGACLAKDRYLVLKHEDFVCNPEKTTREICDFLGISFDPVMFDFSRFSDQSGDRWRSNTAFGDIPDQIVPDSVGRWLSTLQPFEIGFAESVLGDLLPRFGYEMSGCKMKSEDLQLLWDRLATTPLLQSRLKHWLETGEGVEGYPSDPTDSANWQSSTLARTE